MNNIYKITDINGNIIFSLKWFNSASKETMIPQIEAFIYKNIISILLLIKEVYVKPSPDTIDSYDKSEFIEENINLLNDEVIQTISNHYNLDIESLSKVRTIYLNKHNLSNLTELSLLAIRALNFMNLSNLSDSVNFEVELSDSFLYDS